MEEKEICFICLGLMPIFGLIVHKLVTAYFNKTMNNDDGVDYDYGGITPFLLGSIRNERRKKSLINLRLPSIIGLIINKLKLVTTYVDKTMDVDNNDYPYDYDWYTTLTLSSMRNEK